MLMPFVSTLPVKAAASAASSAVVTADMLAPITSTLDANLAVLVPLIPRIVYKFL